MVEIDLSDSHLMPFSWSAEYRLEFYRVRGFIPLQDRDESISSCSCPAFPRACEHSNQQGSDCHISSPAARPNTDRWELSFYRGQWGPAWCWDSGGSFHCWLLAD